VGPFGALLWDALDFVADVLQGGSDVVLGAPGWVEVNCPRKKSSWANHPLCPAAALIFPLAGPTHAIAGIGVHIQIVT